MNSRIPNLQIVTAFAVAAVAGYAAFSVWIVWRNADASVIGDVIGTWKSFAVAAFAFWLGSSSGGKAKDVALGNGPSGQPSDLVSVTDMTP